MEVNKEKIRYILQFFDKDENASQMIEIVNGVYGADNVTANYVHFWFHRFRSGIIDVKDAPRTGKLIVEIVDKIEIDRHDNAGTHTSVVTRQKLWNLAWDVLMRPQYSLDLTPSNYHLLFALKNYLSNKKLGSREDCENLLLEFFTNKDQDFSERGIMKLPLKWQQTMRQNGVYVTHTGQSEAC
ncbi:histone-lysine N-methyltransferase SETMAR [Trichonephila clavipes]|nr:histone-lysine N-methyltransferase SETMAR [Trichonephila clavipes]